MSFLGAAVESSVDLMILMWVLSKAHAWIKFWRIFRHLGKRAKALREWEAAGFVELRPAQFVHSRELSKRQLESISEGRRRRIHLPR